MSMYLRILLSISIVILVFRCACANEPDEPSDSGIRYETFEEYKVRLECNS